MTIHRYDPTDPAQVGMIGGPPSRIVPGLWQGGYPLVRRLPFDVLVLCAEELQAEPDDDFYGTEVVAAPMDDSLDTDKLPGIVEIARVAANKVIAAHRAGKRVLVTCHQGKNRSGLVTGLALTKLYKLPGADAVVLIQRNRPGALGNPVFREFLCRLR